MIRYLAAQRQLYDEEKSCKVGVYVLMAVSSLSIMAVVGLGFWPVTDPQIALLAFILAIMELGILHVIGHKRDDAARVQELFDCELLQLKWNDILVDRPDSLLIQGAEDRFNKKPNHKEAEAELRDWYSRDFTPDTPLAQARLSCQKSNLYWDKDIRNEWRTVLIISLALVVGLTLILSGFLHWTIIDYFKGPFLLILPLVVIVFKEILEQGLAYKRIDELERKADYLLQETKHTDIDEADIIEKSRQLQDEIYNHRKMDSTIPNFIYDRVRKRREPNRAKPVPAEK